LDRPCSGVVIFGKTSFAANKLSSSFQNRMTDKNYFCVVNGEIPENSNQYYHHMIQKTQNSKVGIFDVISDKKMDTKSDQKKESVLTTNKSNQSKSTNKNSIDRNSIELVDAKLKLESIVVIDCGADKNKKQSVLRVELQTGRKHQIRAQMSHIGTYCSTLFSLYSISSLRVFWDL
jgi:23S rRNA-/tRNA-specific pseudouridylate synthase